MLKLFFVVWGIASADSSDNLISTTGRPAAITISRIKNTNQYLYAGESSDYEDEAKTEISSTRTSDDVKSVNTTRVSAGSDSSPSKSFIQSLKETVGAVIVGSSSTETLSEQVQYSPRPVSLSHVRDRINSESLKVRTSSWSNLQVPYT